MISDAPSAAPTPAPVIVTKISRQLVRDKLIEQRKKKREFLTTDIIWTVTKKTYGN